VGLVFLGGLKSGNPIPPIQEDWVSSSASTVFGGLWSTFPSPLMPCLSPSSFCNRSASLSTGFRSKLTAGVCRCLITEFVVFCVYHSLIAAVFVVYHRFGRVFVSNVLRVLMFNNYSYYAFGFERQSVLLSCQRIGAKREDGHCNRGARYFTP